jgi:predicted ester cyclase
VTEWGEVTTLYKDGKTAKFWFNGLYNVADGKIIEARVVFDNMDILNQLGYKFMPPADIIDESGH